MKYYICENNNGLMGIIYKTGLTVIAETFQCIFLWLAVTGLFYLNTVLIHSKCYSIFALIVGILLVNKRVTRYKQVKRQEFINMFCKLIDKESEV